MFYKIIDNVYITLNLKTGFNNMSSNMRIAGIDSSTQEMFIQCGATEERIPVSTSSPLITTSVSDCLSVCHRKLNKISEISAPILMELCRVQEKPIGALRIRGLVKDANVIASDQALTISRIDAGICIKRKQCSLTLDYPSTGFSEQMVQKIENRGTLKFHDRCEIKVDTINFDIPRIIAILRFIDEATPDQLDLLEKTLSVPTHFPLLLAIVADAINAIAGETLFPGDLYFEFAKDLYERIASKQTAVWEMEKVLAAEKNN